MSRPRAGLYVWVTWLSHLMAGEVQCRWAPWFKTHYMSYERVPSNFQVAVWTVEHTQLLDEMVKERSAKNEGVYREDQNQFRVKRPSGLVISGKPDLITIDAVGHCKVYDAKTGTPRQSDIIQVLLYMMCLPYSSPVYKGKNFSGCVVYKNGLRSEIPASAVDKAFTEKVTYFLNTLESNDPPRQTPSQTECRFCDISSYDCSERQELYDAGPNGDNEPEISV
jgi:hypothetical protein